MARGDEFAIYEVYYYADGKIRGYSSTPVFPTGETLEELKDSCDLYVAAFAKPVLEYQE